MAKVSEEKLAQREDLLALLEEAAQDEADRVFKYKVRTVNTTVGRDQLFFEQLKEALAEVFESKLPPPPKPVTKKIKTQRILNVVLSDTHFGARLDAREVGRSYGPTEEARRLAAIIKQVASYKRQYREDTELFVHLLGDVIQGSLHDARDGAPLAEQIATALRILTQAFVYLAHEFPKGVTVFCCTGNHGRNKARHPERAVHQKWDSMETILYVALKEALATYKNVKFEIPKTPHYTWQAFDQRGFATHGDTVLNPGYPNKAINIETLTKQINTINAAAGKKGEEYGLFVVGHVHTGSQTYLGSGSVLITNGCLIPPDSYAISIGIFETACGQWIWESVPGHIVGDSRYVVVNEDTDLDESLDEIVKPFEGI